MKQIKREHVIPYLFILPAFIIHVCMVTAPSMSTLVMSLYDWNGLGNAQYIGLDNFREILTDPIVKLALVHNVQWLLVWAFPLPSSSASSGAARCSSVRCISCPT